MKLLKFIPLQLTLVLILGILSGYFLPINFFVLSGALIFLFLLLASTYFYEKSRLEPSIYYPIITLLLFYVIGVGSITFTNHLNKKHHYTSINSIGQVPQTMLLRVDLQLRSSLYHHKFEAQLLQVNGRKTQGKILLNLIKDSIDPIVSVGIKILVRGPLDEINTPKNPYQFNYKKYLEKQYIYNQVTVSNQDYLIIDSQPSTLNSLVDRFRKRVNHSLKDSGFQNDELSIINALLLGQRQEVSRELIEDYTKAGAIHILAISGLHVGIILWLLTLVLKPLDYLKNGKTLKLIIAIVSLWTFAFIAGLSPSVVRAVTMFTAVAVSLFGKRKSNIFNNLIISMFFLLLIHPIYLFDVGFQLSYLAVFFIVWLQPIIYRLWIPKFKVINYFWELFTVSIAAQLGVLPLSLYYFHQFPSLFFVTNLVVIPILGSILGLGLLVIFFSLLNLLPEFLTTGFQKIIALMNQFIGWIAEQEAFLFQTISFSMVAMVSTYLLIIFCFRWMEQKSYSRFRNALIAFLLLQSVFIYEKWVATSENEFIIFNRSRVTIVGKRTGNRLLLNHSSGSFDTSENLVKSYMIGANVKSVRFIDSINKNMFFKRNILLIDSLGSYDISSFRPDYIVLTYSPKINLDRLIQVLHPKEIIADNSNYNSYVKRWQQTCVRHKINFHYTNEKGAFILNK